MKRISSICTGILASALAVGTVLISGNGVLAVDDVAINKQNFPDDMFRAYVKEYDLDDNDVLSSDEISSVESLYIDQRFGVGSEVSSLKGIEYFYNLNSLMCDSNNITELDLSKNTKLEYLFCPNNKLTNIDLSKNTKLLMVYCNGNNLSSLDVRNCKNIQTVYAVDNKKPVTVNITGTTLANKCINYNKKSQSYVNTDDNSSTNEYAIKVDSNVRIVGAKFAMIPLDTKNFPDNTFRKILSDKYDYNNDGNLELRELMGITDFWGVDFKGVESFKGIEYLEYLTKFEVSDLKLNSLDVSKCARLERLYVTNCNLSSLTFGAANQNLREVDCSGNNLTKLDVSMLKSMYRLECWNNKLTGIDVSKNSELQDFGCWKNNITAIDVSKNSKLYNLDCAYNQLTSLDVTKNAALGWISCGYNQITSLDLSKNKNLKYVWCNDNKIPSIYVDSGALEWIFCQNNELTSLKVLEDDDDFGVQIYCSNNKLTELDLSKLSHLYYLDCSNNNLTSLDLSIHNELTHLLCADNNLSSLDLSEKTDLFELICTGNSIKELDLSKTGFNNSEYYGENRTMILEEYPNYTVAHDDYRDWFIHNGFEDTKDYTDDELLEDEFLSNHSFIHKYDFDKDTRVIWHAGVLATDKDTKVTGVLFKWPNVNIDSKAETVESFAERLYTTCLGRDAEADGKAYWASELKSGKTGAEVAQGFFFSTEYEARKLDNKNFIGTLYETFMGRTPADSEVAYWDSEMNNGKTRKDIFDGFVNSPEWANICLTYGILSGGSAEPTFEKKASAEVTSFAERLYTTCLGRDAEKEGLEWWATELANLRQTGTVAAQGFFFSPEFLNLKTDDNEYVTRLYRTFMGREPEEEGFKYWVGEFKNGKSRQDVFDGFSVAPEFADLCAKAGIMR